MKLTPRSRRLDVTHDRACRVTWRRAGSRCAFTRAEALVLTAGLAVVAITQLPALGRARELSEVAHCQANLLRLARAWSSFTEDHSGRFPTVHHGALAQNPTAARVGWAAGWLDWTMGPANTNTLFLTEDRYSQLAVYLDRDAAVFRCPSDRYVSPLQAERGWTERARSVSANLFVGGEAVESGPADPIYRVTRRVEDLVIPGPANTLVFIEEHPDSMNDPGFYSPRANGWIDLPASFHDGGASMAFADGHAELRLWQGERIRLPVRTMGFAGVTLPAGDPDVHFVSFRTPRKTEKSH